MLWQKRSAKFRARNQSRRGRAFAAPRLARYNDAMSWLQWIGENWFTGLQTIAIVSGFTFTCITLRRDSYSRRISSLFQITANHRDVWEKALNQPKLQRVLSASADIARQPVTVGESIFVGFLILHLNSAHQAIRGGLLDSPEGLTADIRTFFALPVPRAVWEAKRQFQDAEFVAFVEAQITTISKNPSAKLTHPNGVTCALGAKATHGFFFRIMSAINRII
jgi:hypothetical protein